MNRRDLLKQGVVAAGALGLASTASAQGAATSTLYADWVHGTSVEVEDPGSINGVTRFGWGADFRGKAGKFAWFHISFATPVIIDDVRPTLEKVFVFYKTTAADIRNVHIYDGPRKIRAFDGLSLEGDRSGGILPTNTWAITPAATLAFGLGISIGVQFHIGFDTQINTGILFTTAGADFRRKQPQAVIQIEGQRRRVP
jgi:hypothetical protein